MVRIKMSGNWLNDCGLRPGKKRGADKKIGLALMGAQFRRKLASASASARRWGTLTRMCRGRRVGRQS
jgi:hypothetical protein